MTTDPIVVGTDGSATAERAVDVAAELAEALGADLHLVTSHDGARADASTVLSRARRRLGDRGLPARAHLCSGDPAEMLLAIAEEARAQMLVVGARAEALGSVPDRISNRAPCGVLIVPAEAEAVLGVSPGLDAAAGPSA